MRPPTAASSPMFTHTPGVNSVTPAPAAVSPRDAPVPQEAMAPRRAITFTTGDSVQLAGTLFGSGETAAILAHQGTPGADQTSWHSFAQVLARHSFADLGFDFRGCGQAEGPEMSASSVRTLPRPQSSCEVSAMRRMSVLAPAWVELPAPGWQSMTTWRDWSPWAARWWQAEVIPSESQRPSDDCLPDPGR